jgi:hypothetical protein
MIFASFPVSFKNMERESSQHVEGATLSRHLFFYLSRNETARRNDGALPVFHLEVTMETLRRLALGEASDLHRLASAEAHDDPRSTFDSPLQSAARDSSNLKGRSHVNASPTHGRAMKMPMMHRPLLASLVSRSWLRFGFPFRG